VNKQPQNTRDLQALDLANKELAYQNEEKEKRAAELIIANKELAYQNEEKEKRAAELIIANRELAYQNEEKEKRAAELIIANRELAYQNEEKEKRAAELLITNNELKKVEEYLKDYIKGLEEIMFMTSHKIRGPLTNILGISIILNDYLDEPDKLKTFVEYIQQSALSIDALTKELATYIVALEKKKR
jgi:signal transduction histidine kinase